MRGLRDGEARALLSSAVGFLLDERVRDRIIAETRGNPLALLELPRGLTAAQLAGGFGLLGARALSGRIEESFARRLEALPEEARRLLLVAAAEPVGDPLLVWRAAERLGIAGRGGDRHRDGRAADDRRARDVPPSAGALGGLRSAPAERAPGGALGAGGGDRPAGRSRPPCLASCRRRRPAPDEEVASELERSAGRAQARGGLAAAAAFLQRSVALTGDSARRVDRALAAARAKLYAGAFDAALEDAGGRGGGRARRAPTGPGGVAARTDRFSRQASAATLRPCC